MDQILIPVNKPFIRGSDLLTLVTVFNSAPLGGGGANGKVRWEVVQVYLVLTVESVVWRQSFS